MDHDQSLAHQLVNICTDGREVPSSAGEFQLGIGRRLETGGGHQTVKQIPLAGRHAHVPNRNPSMRGKHTQRLSSKPAGGVHTSYRPRILGHCSIPSPSTTYL